MKRIQLVALTALLVIASGVGAGQVFAGTGPYLVKDIDASGSSQPEYLAEMGGKLYFSAKGGGKGRELWVSDGTSVGTKRLKDIRPGSQGSHPRNITAIGGMLYFSADGGNGEGRELWRSDGTTAGTWALADINPGPGSSDPGSFAAFQNAAYFSADDGVTGQELWRTYGANGTTTRVKDIDPGPAGSHPTSLVQFAGKLVFLRTDCPTAAPPPGEGDCLYKSDGTAAGTKLFKDRAGHRVIGHFDSLKVIGSRLFFILNESDIWRSNGGSSTLRSLGAFGPWSHLVGSGGRAFFTVDNELWKSDGTVAGTVKVTDVATDGNPTPFLSLGIDVSGMLFFVADNLLYKSNGTASGTAEVDPGEEVLDSSGSTEMAAIGSKLFYSGPATLDAGSCKAGDLSLWRSDGTPGGTFEVSPTPSSCRIEALTPVGGALYFVANDGTHGLELWRYVP